MKKPVSPPRWGIFFGGVVLGVAGTCVYRTAKGPEWIVKEVAAIKPVAAETTRPADLEALVGAFRKSLDAGSVAARAHLLDEISETNEATALSLSAEGGVDAQTRAQLLQKWIRRDPAAAWQWVVENGKREPRLLQVSLYQMAAAVPDLMMPSVLPGGALYSPEIATEAVQALVKAGDERSAQQWVERWAQSGSPDGVGPAAEQVAVAMLAESPPAASYWLGSLPPSPELNHAAASFAAEWAGTDPKAAMDWVTSLPAGFSNAEAMQNVFEKWADLDLVDATKWLGEYDQTTGSSDSLVLNLLSQSNIAQVDPKAAMDWAELVQDPAMRLDAIPRDWRGHGLCPIWLAIQPGAAIGSVTRGRRPNPGGPGRHIDLVLPDSLRVRAFVATARPRTSFRGDRFLNNKFEFGERLGYLASYVRNQAGRNAFYYFGRCHDTEPHGRMWKECRPGSCRHRC